MSCTVAEFVREALVVLDEKALVAEGARLMAERNMGSVVVTRANEIVGLFTEHDLVHRVVARSLDPTEVSLGEVCTRQVVTISPGASCREAILKMRANRCRRLLVYQDSKFIGMVKLPDIAHGIAAQDTRGDWLPNVIVKSTFVLVLIVIVMLLLRLPDMVNIFQQTSGP